MVCGHDLSHSIKVYGATVTAIATTLVTFIHNFPPTTRITTKLQQQPQYETWIMTFGFTRTKEQTAYQQLEIATTIATSVHT